MSFGNPEVASKGHAGSKRMGIAFEVLAECDRQVEKWGIQSWPTYTQLDIFDHGVEFGTEITADSARELCDYKAQTGQLSWFDICNEEYLEARVEAVKGDKEALRVELIQAAACLISAIASLDKNGLEGA